MNYFAIPAANFRLGGLRELFLLESGYFGPDTNQALFITLYDLCFDFIYNTYTANRRFMVGSTYVYLPPLYILSIYP